MLTRGRLRPRSGARGEFAAEINDPPLERLRQAAGPDGGELERAYDQLRARRPDRWGRTSESEILEPVREFLRSGRPRPAAAVARLTAAACPRSSGALCAQAEAELAAGNRDRAGQLARRALEIDGEYRPAKILLESMEAAHAGR